MNASLPQPSGIRFDAQGLVPVIVQDRLTGEIRMFAYANEVAVRRTLETGRATFWSRSRSEIWEKGLTSGHSIQVSRILVDCDGDCLVYSSEPHGPSCHTGQESCFFRELGAGEWTPVSAEQSLLPTLEGILEARKASTGKSSYTKSLYDGGPPAIGKKIREEARELADAIASESDDRVVSEAADEIYHLVVGLRHRAIALRRVFAELGRRFGKSGHEEKASR